jgi:hypothetical protein
MQSINEFKVKSDIFILWEVKLMWTIMKLCFMQNRKKNGFKMGLKCINI